MAGKIKLGALELTAPVFNSAGPLATTLEELQAIADSAAGAVVTKSFSTVPWPGNPEPNLFVGPHYSINSIGLKNRGVGYFLDAAAKLKTAKPVIASLVGKTPDEYLELVRQVNHSQFSTIELNLSCPNLETHEPIGSSPAETERLLKKIMALSTKPVSIKLPPFASRGEFKEMAEVVQRAGVNHVVLINTYPFAAVLDGGKSVIAPNQGVGGLGGAALKPIAFAHVMLFRQFANGQVPIVGVGGVQTKQDVQDFLDAGATAVQVGTATIGRGPALFADLV